MVYATAVLLAALLACTEASPVAKITRDDDTLYRLPTHFTPKKYTIHISPDYNGGKTLVGIERFSGSVSIEGKIDATLKELSYIALHHSKEMDIEDICLEDASEEATTQSPSTEEPTEVSSQSPSTEEPPEISTSEKTSRERNIGRSGPLGTKKEENRLVGNNRARNENEDKIYGNNAGEIKDENISHCTKIDIDDDCTYSDLTEILNCTLKDPIPAESFSEKYTLHITYKALIYGRNDGHLTGLYYSSFKYKPSESGEEEEEEVEEEQSALLVTQFESTHARKAFPCFDEPHFRATFDLTIDLEDGIGAISNEKATDGNIEPSKVTFKTTPRMSTYLLAFIIYEKKSFISMTLNAAHAFHATWGRIDAINAGEGELSEKDGPRMIEVMTTFTGINYSLDKMDQVAVPDFQAGAMENWGLIIYKELAILYNPKTGSTAAHKRVSDILAHELAHQWFGNLVVTKWWDSIWLNEGFADYYESLIMAVIYPSWRMEERFLLEEQMSVFPIDASPDSVPLTNKNVKTPTDIDNHFGSITYKKGASVLRQISNVVGKDQFQKAIKKYLSDRQLEYATPELLFERLIEYNEEDISRLNNTELNAALESWTLTKGFPVVTVERQTATSFKISQVRFLETQETNVDEMPLYYVPLTWATSDESKDLEGPKTPEGWLTNKQTSIWQTIEGLSEDQWVLFNPWQSGYYRVNYDDKMWDMILTALKEDTKSVAPIDRAAIIDNLLSFARAGHVSYERALTGIQFLRDDEDFIPWAAARTALAHLDRMFGSDVNYKRFIRDLVRSTFKKESWDAVKSEGDFAEDNVKLTHRVNVFTLACGAEDSDCLDNAERHLKEDTTGVDKELEDVVYCYGLKRGNRNQWDKVWQQWEAAASNPARRSLLTKALGCINDEAILELYLERSINESFVQKKEAYTVFVAVYSNPDGVNTAFDFLHDKTYETIHGSYGDNGMKIILPGLASRLTTPHHKEMLGHVLKGRPEEEEILKIVQENIVWAEKFSQDVKTTIGAASVNAVATSIVLFCTTIITFLR